MNILRSFVRLTGRALLAGSAHLTSEAVIAAPGTYGQQVVAAVLMGEAWGEGKTAMLAVAEVIRTRADAAGLSPLAIVQQPSQFSCLNGIEPRELIARFIRHADFKLALEISRRVYNRPQELPGITKSATHFNRAGTLAHWARGHQPVARFGTLNFYRLRD
jgi:hypothetical protein